MLNSNKKKLTNFVFVVCLERTKVNKKWKIVCTLKLNAPSHKIFCFVLEFNKPRAKKMSENTLEAIWLRTESQNEQKNKRQHACVYTQILSMSICIRMDSTFRWVRPPNYGLISWFSPALASRKSQSMQQQQCT